MLLLLPLSYPWVEQAQALLRFYLFPFHSPSCLPPHFPQVWSCAARRLASSGLEVWGSASRRQPRGWE